MADTEDTGVLVDHGDGKPAVSLPPGSFDGDKLAADLETIDHDDADAVVLCVTAAQFVVEAPLVREVVITAEDAVDTLMVTIEETGSNGFYTVSAPWLAEPLKIRGKANAEAEQARLQAEGPPAGDLETDLNGGTALGQDGGEV